MIISSSIGSRSLIILLFSSEPGGEIVVGLKFCGFLFSGHAGRIGQIHHQFRQAARHYFFFAPSRFFGNVVNEAGNAMEAFAC